MTEFRKLPVKNLARRPQRTAALAAMTALMAFILFAGTIVIESLRNGLDSAAARLGADIICIPASAKSVDAGNILLNGTTGYFYMKSSLVEDIAEAEGVEQVSAQLYFASLRASCCSTAVQLIGIDQDTDFVVQPWIEQSYDRKMGDLEVVAGSRVGAEPGETITFYDTDCTVVAKLDSTGTGMDTAVYATMDTIRLLLDAARSMGHELNMPDEPENLVSAVYVKVKDGTKVKSVADYLKVHVRKVTTIQTKSMITGISDSLAGVSGTITALIAAVWVLTLLLLIIALRMISNERRREFALLRVMGASRSMLSGMVIRETLLISLAGGLAGTLLAALTVIPFSSLIETKLGLPYLLPSWPHIIAAGALALAAVLIAGPLSASFTARRLSRQDPGIILRES